MNSETPKTPINKTLSRRAMIAARQKNSLFWQTVHLLGSLQLALLLLATIGIACAVATFTESHFDTKVAHAMIYKAPWFLAWLSLLCLNLFAVTLTRWPWEKKHLGFVITHYGIITLLLGAAIGSKYGFEGNVTLQRKGAPVQKITTSKSVLEIESPLTHNLYLLPFDASLTHPSKEHPKQLAIPESPLHMVIDDWSEALQQQPKLLASQEGEDALLFRLSSQALHQEQLVALSLGENNEQTFDFFGLAKIRLTPELKPPVAEPSEQLLEKSAATTATSMSSLVHGSDPTAVPLVKPATHKPWLELALDHASNQLHYQLGRNDTVKKKGDMIIGESIPLGWADWQLQLLQSGHHEKIVFSTLPAADATASTSGTPGFHTYLQDQENSQGHPEWVASGEVTPLLLDSTLVRVGYGLELRPISFSIELLDFQIPRDEGTDNPSDFRAVVRFTNLKTGITSDGLIRMNHPASFPGGFLANLTGINYKFSQAEWNPRNLDETTLQVLYDPGWLPKWLGALGICIGIAMMFYFKK